VRWQYRDAGLLWLFVPAYAIHVAEEWFAGFPRWVEQIAGRPLPDAAFLIISAVIFALLVAAVLAAIRAEHNGWLAVAIATIVLVNTITHSASAAITASYAPGLLSAVVLYVPLGLLTMMRAIDQAPRGQLMRGVISGVMIHAAAFVVAFATTRLGPR
jgi:hypothetical protein